MNIWDIVIIIVVAGLVGFAIWRMIRNRRQGKGGCSCGCANCPQRCDRRR